jgi:hypothetical protein
VGVVDHLDHGHRRQGVERGPALVSLPGPQYQREEADEGHVAEEAGDLPGLVAGVDPGHPVHSVEPRLGHRRVDGVDGRPVGPRAARLPLEGRATLGIGPQPVLPQVGQVGRAGRVAVGVGARDLDPAVPGVAVQVVGKDRLAGEGGQAEDEGHAHDRRHRVAPGEPEGAEDAGSPHHRPQGEAHEQRPAVVPQRLGGDEGQAQAGAGGRGDGEAGRRPALRPAVGHGRSRPCRRRSRPRPGSPGPRPPAPATPPRGARRPAARRR